MVNERKNKKSILLHYTQKGTVLSEFSIAVKLYVVFGVRNILITLMHNFSEKLNQRRFIYKVKLGQTVLS